MLRQWLPPSATLVGQNILKVGLKQGLQGSR